MDIKPIRNDDDLKAAITEVGRLMDLHPERGSPDGDRLEIMADLVAAYEAKHYPIPAATPLDILRFHMEQNGLTPDDLAQVIGSRPQADSILVGRRPLSLAMITAINDAWKIPADLLVPALADMTAE